jgi:hypothetical protein
MESACYPVFGSELFTDCSLTVRPSLLGGRTGFGRLARVGFLVSGCTLSVGRRSSFVASGARLHEANQLARARHRRRSQRLRGLGCSTLLPETSGSRMPVLFPAGEYAAGRRGEHNVRSRWPA